MLLLSNCFMVIGDNSFSLMYLTLLFTLNIKQLYEEGEL